MLAVLLEAGGCAEWLVYNDIYCTLKYFATAGK